jgi:ATP:ADP antiporter, AAA family
MRDKLSTLMGITPKEESDVTLLLIQSIFIGIFIGTFDITAYSLLLSFFDEKALAWGFMLSGSAAFVIIAIFTVLKSKLKFSNLLIVNYLLILVITGSFFAVIRSSISKEIILAGFIMTAPVNILSLLSLRGTARRVLKARRENVYRWLEAGLFAGICIGSFLVPIIKSFPDIIATGFLSFAVVLFVQFPINARSEQMSARTLYDYGSYNRLPVNVLSNSQTRLLVLFAALSALAMFLTQYIFLASYSRNYSSSTDLASFLGIFTGVVMIIITGSKIILHRQRLDNSFVIYPSILVLLAILVTISFILKDFLSIPDGFQLIIPAAGINLILTSVYRNSVQIPSFRIIFFRYTKELLPKVRSCIDGIMNETGLLFSGIILTLFGIPGFIKLIHFSILLLLVTSVLVIAGIRLLREYRKSLIVIREKEKVAIPVESMPLNSFSASIDFRRDYFKLITGDYSALARINDRYFEMLVNRAITHNDINLVPVFKRISVSHEIDNTLRERSLEILDILNTNESTVDQSLKALAGSRLPQTTEILKLLRNNSLESKRNALYMIGKFRLTDLLSMVCESLNTPGLSNDAYEVLLSFGTGVEDELIRFYLINSGNQKLSRIILQLLGTVCTRNSSGFLFSHLWSSSRFTRELSVKSLLACRYKPAEEEISRLENIAFETIGIITWNLGVEAILKQNRNAFLLEKITSERIRWEEFLFNVLSLIYGPEIIDVAGSYLRGNNDDMKNHGLEILKVTVSNPLLTVLLILYEKLPLKRKLLKLAACYPGEVSKHINLEEDLVNRDYNLLTLWTKACTLRSIGRIENQSLGESVIALLFSPEDIIQEESAYLIARTDRTIYDKVSSRIHPNIKRKLDVILSGSNDKRTLLFEKVQFLTNCFEGIPSYDLFSLAAELHLVYELEKQTLNNSGSIIWPVLKNRGSASTGMIYNSSNTEIGLTEGEKTPYYMLSLTSVEEFNFLYPEYSKIIQGYFDSIRDPS